MTNYIFLANNELMGKFGNYYKMALGETKETKDLYIKLTK